MLSKMDFEKIQLISNSKKPVLGKWKKTKEDLKGNYGILTGIDNNITVIDIDFYDKDGNTFKEEDSLFLKRFGSDYVNYFNTMTQKTANGGYHLIFQYDEDIKQTSNSNNQIDVRNDGGYIVGYGSVVKGKTYQLYKNVPVVPIPKELKDWLLENIYTKSQKKRNKREKERKANPTDEGKMSYLRNDNVLKEMFNKLPNDYFSDKNKWLNFTSFCKTVGCKELWDNYSSSKCPEKYNKDNNLKQWETVEIEKGCFESLINIKELKLVKYYKYYLRYKELPEEKLEFNTVINKQKLGYEFFKENKGNMVVKSDTGTGKTTSFKHYIGDEKFISIVSRISLADEQYRTFNEHGIECSHYKDLGRFDDKVVITIDSLLKVYNNLDIDVSECVLFLDEFNSIIEHLLVSTTLKNKRIEIFEFLIKMMKECKRFICVDADISSVSIEFLKFVNRKYCLLKNEYLHNKGVEAFEMKTLAMLIQKMKKEEKFICCCDSKKNAILLYEKMGGKDDPHMILITSDTIQIPDLNKYLRIIFSPKVLYGLDSNMNRPVYCYYTTDTINPNHMLQQIARERTITELNYYFEKKKMINCYYIDYEDTISTKEDLSNLGEGYHKFYGMDKKTEERFLKLYCMLDYKNDCYKSNKFLHFVLLLQKRGFHINNGLINIEPKLDKGTIVQDYLVEMFDSESEKVGRLMDMLSLEKEDIKDYKSLLINQTELNKHFAISNYCFKEDKQLKDNMYYKNEMSILKIESIENKILFIKELEKQIGLNKDGWMETENVLSKGESKSIYNKYKALFRDRSTDEPDLTDSSKVIEILAKTYKNLLGHNKKNPVIESKQFRVDGERIRKYKFNDKFKEQVMGYHKTLYDKRQCSTIDEKVEYNF